MEGGRVGPMWKKVDKSGGGSILADILRTPFMMSTCQHSFRTRGLTVDDVSTKVDILNAQIYSLGL